MVLYNRGFSYYVVISVPSELIPIFKKKQIWRSLHTTDKKVAKIRSLPIIAKVNATFLRKQQQMSRLKGFDNEMEDDWDLLNIPPPTEPFEYSDRAIESIALDFCIEQISFDEAKLIKSVDTLNYYNQLLNEYIADFHLHNYLRIEPTLDAYLNRHRMQKPTDYIL